MGPAKYPIKPGLWPSWIRLMGLHGSGRRLGHVRFGAGAAVTFFGRVGIADAGRCPGCRSAGLSPCTDGRTAGAERVSLPDIAVLDILRCATAKGGCENRRHGSGNQ